MHTALAGRDTPEFTHTPVVYPINAVLKAGHVIAAHTYVTSFEYTVRKSITRAAIDRRPTPKWEPKGYAHGNRVTRGLGT